MLRRAGAGLTTLQQRVAGVPTQPRPVGASAQVVEIRRYAMTTCAFIGKLQWNLKKHLA